MWIFEGKQIALAINTKQVQHIQFDDGTTHSIEFKIIKSFNRGIFVNPTLDKRKYLSLLKVFHPDVSDLDSKVATQIAQAIINAKDGLATATNPLKTNCHSPTTTKTESASNYQSWWQQYDWTSTQAKSKSGRENSHQKRTEAKPKLDFETLLSYVPTKYWKIFGVAETFERDTSVDFRIYKRCYYGYFDTELEIVFRQGCVYREKIVAIHRNTIHILHKLDLNQLTKNDLWTICDYEAIAYTKIWRKYELVDEIFRHFLSINPQSDHHQNYWTLILTSPKPVWKSKFIRDNYHHNFDQFNCHQYSENAKAHNKPGQKTDDTSSYLNCGQYLRIINQWLERDEFLYFLRLTRNLAYKLKIQTSDVHGYPGYPLEILDLAWQKMS